MKSSSPGFKLAISLALVAACSLSACTPEMRRSFANVGNIVGSRFGIANSDVDALLTASEKLSAASRGFTDEQEYYLGRGVAANILGRFKPYKGDPIQSYVNAVGRVVAMNSDRPETFKGYHFLVLDSEELNAVSAPSGFVFTTRGFLKLLGDEDELAAVLAHEVAHVVLAHGVSAISQSNVTSALSVIGQQVADRTTSGVSAQLTAAFGDSVAEVTEKLLVKGYSRSQEYDADRYAVEILKRSGYSPLALNGVLSKLESASGDDKGWFSTHPDPSKRLSELKSSQEDVAPQEDLLAFKGRKAREERFKRTAQGV